MSGKIRVVWQRFSRSWLFSMALMGLAVFSFRSAVADWNDVPTGSMQPTILIGDRITVNKLAYDLHVPFTKFSLLSWDDPERGDIVTCWSPADGARLVKRVVGLPGDTIAMQGGRLIINGRPIAYRMIDPPAAAAAMGEEAAGKIFLEEDLPGCSHVVAWQEGGGSARDFGPVTVPADSYLMLGDNRDFSADSRYFGFVPRRDVCGKAFGVAFSLDRGNHWAPRWSRLAEGLI
ncbi:signal peptidase I [bacterium]|nr:signal peptidase I [bacterium]